MCINNERILFVCFFVLLDFLEFCADTLCVVYCHEHGILYLVSHSHCIRLSRRNTHTLLRFTPQGPW